MPYLGGCYLLGDAPTPETVADAGLSLAASSRQVNNFKAAYRAIQRMSPAQRAGLLRAAEARIARLPAARRQQIVIMAQRTQGIDPRVAEGLGTAGVGAAASVASTVSTIASITATLATLGLQTYQFIENKKETEAQRKAAERQAKVQEAAVKQEIAAQKQRMELERQAFAAQQAPAGAPFPGATGTGQPPTSKMSTIIVGGGLALAAALAFK